jgi:hypothetical protein
MKTDELQIIADKVWLKIDAKFVGIKAFEMLSSA